MKHLNYALCLLAVSLSSCDKKNTASSLDAEQLVYALGGQRYTVQIPKDFDTRNDLLGFSLEFDDGTSESLGGIGDISPGDEVLAVCLPEGKHGWLFSIFSDKFRGRIPIALPSQYHSHVVSTFTNPDSNLSIGDSIVEFGSDHRAENGMFPKGESIRIVLTINPRSKKTSEQDASSNGG
jgi:hypothetical protein